LTSRTIVCIASGPSLIAEDCDEVRWSGCETIVINTSYRLAPWADHLYAGDHKWWETHIKDVPTDCRKWTCSQRAADDYGLEYHRKFGPFNSGLRAIELALEMGADRVLLLGYDCDLSRGVHWHGAHRTTKNPTDKQVADWQGQFKRLQLGGAQVINCSRQTALRAFPCQDLHEALHGRPRERASKVRGPCRPTIRIRKAKQTGLAG